MLTIIFKNGSVEKIDNIWYYWVDNNILKVCVLDNDGTTWEDEYSITLIKIIKYEVIISVRNNCKA